MAVASRCIRWTGSPREHVSQPQPISTSASTPSYMRKCCSASDQTVRMRGSSRRWSAQRSAPQRRSRTLLRHPDSFRAAIGMSGVYERYDQRRSRSQRSRELEQLERHAPLLWEPAAATTKIRTSPSDWRMPWEPKASHAVSNTGDRRGTIPGQPGATSSRDCWGSCSSAPDPAARTASDQATWQRSTPTPTDAMRISTTTSPIKKRRIDIPDILNR